MGYSKTKRAIERVKTFLKTMADSNQSITWSVKDNPERVASLIRQGIAAAKHQKMSEYSQLLQKFTIKVKDKFVIAEIVSMSSHKPVEDLYTASIASVVISDEMTAEDIMTYLIKNDVSLRHTNLITFTNFVRPNITSDIKKFESYCDHIHKLKVDMGEATLTLKRM